MGWLGGWLGGWRRNRGFVWVKRVGGWVDGDSFIHTCTYRAVGTLVSDAEE